MEWLLFLIIIFTLVCLFLSGLPVAFCFMIVITIGAFFIWRGEAGLLHIAPSFYASLTSFSLIPIPLFILMGDLMFTSGIASLAVNAVDKCLGRLPGRLSILAVVAGTLFGALTGSSMASVAVLGSSLLPEMEKRGYKKPMTLGPILGSAGIAIMIPPSALAVLVAGLAQVSVSKVLVAIIIPGILLSIIYLLYILIRCVFQPALAPAYEIKTITLREKVAASVKYLLPFGFIVFLVIGVIVFGLASPTEASALGVLGTLLLTILYKKFSWKMLKQSLINTVQLTSMIFIIIAGAKIFTQIIATTGIIRLLLTFVGEIDMAPILIIIVMQLIILILGAFMEAVSILMLTIPIFMPLVLALGFDGVWFAVLMLLNIEIAISSPPFGTNIFVMQRLAPAGTTTKNIYWASVPFILLDIFVLGLLIIFPALVLWLPNVMH